MQKLLRKEGLEGTPKTDICMLVQIRMYLGGAQPAVVKIPKKPLEGAALPGEIVGHNKFEDEKLTEG